MRNPDKLNATVIIQKGVWCFVNIRYLITLYDSNIEFTGTHLNFL